MSILASFKFPQPPDIPPPQPYHKYPDLPLFKSIWSPIALQDMSILTWSYRITLSAMSFMFVALLVDAVVGNLYRYTFGNLKIYIDNEHFHEKQRIYLEERNKVLANYGFAVLTAAGILAVAYKMSALLTFPDPPPPIDPTQDHRLLKVLLLFSPILSIIPLGLCFSRPPYEVQRIFPSKRSQFDLRKDSSACTMNAGLWLAGSLTGKISEEPSPDDLDAILIEGDRKFVEIYNGAEVKPPTLSQFLLSASDIYSKLPNGVYMYGFGNNAFRLKNRKDLFVGSTSPEKNAENFWQALIDPLTKEAMRSHQSVGAILTSNGSSYGIKISFSPSLIFQFYDSHTKDHQLMQFTSQEKLIGYLIYLTAKKCSARPLYPVPNTAIFPITLSTVSFQVRT